MGRVRSEINPLQKTATQVFFELTILSTLFTLVAWAPYFFVIYVDRSCAADESPATPLLRFEHIFDSGPWVAIACALAFVIFAMVRSRPDLQGRSRRRKVVVIGGALAVQAALFFGAVLATLQFDPHWLFGRTVPNIRAESPDGQRIAWAGRSCFFGCSVVVWVQEAGALKMKEVQRVDVGKEEAPDPVLEWSVDSKTVAVKPAAQ